MLVSSSALAFRGFVKSCKGVNVKFPSVVSTFTGGAIAMAGDVACQKLEGGNGIDWRRASNMFVYRTFIFGPQYLAVLRGLEKYVNFATKSVWKTVASKIALDQFVFGPVAIVQFYVCLTMLEGGTLVEGVDKLCRVGGETLRAGWMLWTPVQALTFGVIPPAFRLQFVSTLQVGWNAWLSSVNNRASQPTVVVQ